VLAGPRGGPPCASWCSERETRWPWPLADVVAEQVHGSRCGRFYCLDLSWVLAFVMLRIPDRGVRIVFVPVDFGFLGHGRSDLVWATAYPQRS